MAIRDRSATEQKIKTATTRALNRTSRWAKTRVARETADILNIRVGLVKETLVIVKARQSTLEATVGLSKKAGAIKAAKIGTVKQNKAGVRVGKKQFDRAFPATVKNGHFGAFRRKGKTRLPIQEVFIVITGKMSQVMDALQDGPAYVSYTHLTLPTMPPV